MRHDQVAFENDIGDEVADLSKLQPRFGIAWDIGGDAKTVARANWGRFMHPNALTLPSFARVNQFPTVRWLSCSSFRSELGENCRDAYPGEQTVGGITFSNWVGRPGQLRPERLVLQSHVLEHAKRDLRGISSRPTPTSGASGSSASSPAAPPSV